MKNAKKILAIVLSLVMVAAVFVACTKNNNNETTQPEADSSTVIGLLYDSGQDASTSAIAAAKEYLDEKGIAYKEYTGTTVDEVSLAVDSAIADGVSAIFTPSDNTIMTAELSIYEKLAEAGIPHFTGADSFALNGAFLGYGVDYANLGSETADMVFDILVNNQEPSTLAVKTFDNGTATINTDICTKLGYDFADISAKYQPFCQAIKEIKTAESFEDPNASNPAAALDSGVVGAQGGTVYKVGICNYVDDASLNQIVSNIKVQLDKLGKENNVAFDISYDNCNADANVLGQIIANFQADDVDLMVGVATPVAMAMQSATEGSDTPVVFAAVSDPVSTELVSSLEAPGANVTGTSDYLDTKSIFNLILETV